LITIRKDQSPAEYHIPILPVKNLHFEKCLNRAYFLFLSLAWVSAEAATLFSALVDLGLLKILPALLATREDVCSFLDFPIIAPWKNSLVLILLFSKPAAGAKL
jgi:hypothetical protein